MNPPAALARDVLARLPSSALCVGLSGGMDSVVLLHLLAHAGRPGLRAIHVNHGVHAKADEWAEQCLHWCAQWRVPCTVRRAHVIPRGDGLEAALRNARYAVFEAELQPDETLVLAHHLDDQAETFLLRALRASGIDGLGAMAEERALGAARLARPLLDIERGRLHDYAIAHNLQWIEDPSNADTGFDRNFLRHRVLPLLRERWPQADAALARSARLCRRDAALLDVEDARWLASAATLNPQVIRRDVVAALPEARRLRVLRAWIASLQLPPPPAHVLQQADDALMHAAADAQARVCWAGVAMRPWRKLLHAGRACAPLAHSWREQWDGRAALALPGGGLLELDGAVRLPQECVVHTRISGERIALPGRTHSHALKHVLQDLGVPPWEREQLPLLSTAEGELLAAGDLVYSRRFDGWLREHGARLRWRPVGHSDFSVSR